MDNAFQPLAGGSILPRLYIEMSLSQYNPTSKAIL